MTKPIEKQLPERQITILAQHFLPYLSYSVIKTWLDDIAQDVLLRLKIKFPSHSIFSTSLKRFLYWKSHNIYDNYWDGIESMQIMRTLEKYVFSELEIHKLLQSLIISDLSEYENKRVRNFTLC